MAWVLLVLCMCEFKIALIKAHIQKRNQTEDEIEEYSSKGLLTTDHLFQEKIKNTHLSKK